jgi:LDH2 family malate/lactate/ureidoglycolate dehydrogenase
VARFDPCVLARFVANLLLGLEVPASDAALVADCLVSAELEGQSSHGLSRLPLWAERLREGLITARPELRVVRESAATVLLDAGNALGPVAGARAMQLACERARAAGVGVCAVRHSNHLGSLGWYVERAAGEGLIGLATTNTPPAMAPPGGRRPYLGTNPIAAGFPTSDEPVVVDLATSQVARGRLLQAARSGRAVPLGWALDAEGHPTTDPQLGIDGSLVPMGGAKGFALALVVEVLSGVLAGAGVGPQVAGTYASSDRVSDVGHLLVAIDAEAFGPGFRERMDGLAAGIRAVEPVDPGSPIRLPGDRRREERARRMVSGIDLPAALVDELNRIAGACGTAALA